MPCCHLSEMSAYSAGSIYTLPQSALGIFGNYGTLWYSEAGANCRKGLEIPHGYLFPKHHGLPLQPVGLWRQLIDDSILDSGLLRSPARAHAMTWITALNLLCVSHRSKLFGQYDLFAIDHYNTCLRPKLAVEVPFDLRCNNNLGGDPIMNHTHLYFGKVFATSTLAFIWSAQKNSHIALTLRNISPVAGGPARPPGCLAAGLGHVGA